MSFKKLEHYAAQLKETSLFQLRNALGSAFKAKLMKRKQIQAFKSVIKRL